MIRKCKCNSTWPSRLTSPGILDSARTSPLPFDSLRVLGLAHIQSFVHQIRSSSIVGCCFSKTFTLAKKFIGHSIHYDIVSSYQIILRACPGWSQFGGDDWNGWFNWLIQAGWLLCLVQQRDQRRRWKISYVLFPLATWETCERRWFHELYFWWIQRME